MYGDPKQLQNLQRGPPPPPRQMMPQPSASSTTFNSEYHHPAPAPQAPRYNAHAGTVDYTSTVVRYMQIRMWQRDSRDRSVLQPTSAAAIDVLPTAAYLDNPSTSFAAKYVQRSVNNKHSPINRVLWMPTGRRLITGSQRGEFTLWNGTSFNFELLIQAHDQAIRSMVWSHNDNWMVSGDDRGVIKYWQNNMTNVKTNTSAHKESVCDLSFCRTDLKFCSCSDDTTVKVWDFKLCQEERSLSGHGWDVKSVDWHPTNSLLVSGGKDNLVKLWDAKTGRELSTLHGHKNHVLCVKWNQNGNWLLTAGKDNIIKLYDIRAMKELDSFRGHPNDVTVLAWHPFHEEYFVSGSLDGKIFHWLVGHETTQVEVNAHDKTVWDIAWHPFGHLLCSGSDDHTTKFWCRSRPGDIALDTYNIAPNQGYGQQNPALANEGPSAAGVTQNVETIPGVGVPLPLLDTSTQGYQQQPLPGSMPFGVPRLPPGPHPSFVVANQQQGYQQNPQQIQQQQMPHMPMGPPNMQQLQPPSHMSLLPRPHLQFPPQRPPLGMPSPVPFSMPGSLPRQLPIPTIPMPNPMGMQGTMNQRPPLPQSHFTGMNTMHSGGAPSARGFPNNMQGPANASIGQMYPQGGQTPLMPGFNPYQSGLLPRPPPPGPPRGQTPQ